MNRPAATIPTSSSRRRSGASCASVGLTGVACLRSGLQAVSDPAYRADHGRSVGVELLAQIADVHLHHVDLAFEAVVPNPVSYLGLGDNMAGVDHQVVEQSE